MHTDRRPPLLREQRLILQQPVPVGIEGTPVAPLSPLEAGKVVAPDALRMPVINRIGMDLGVAKHITGVSVGTKVALLQLGVLGVAAWGLKYAYDKTIGGKG